MIPERLATIRIELDINAQRIISQFQSSNQQLEEAITKGIEKALNELLAEDNFEQIICDATKEQVENIVHQAASSFNLKHSIYDAIAASMEKKITEYADFIAEKVTKNLKTI